MENTHAPYAALYNVGTIAANGCLELYLHVPSCASDFSKVMFCVLVP